MTPRRRVAKAEESKQRMRKRKGTGRMIKWLSYTVAGLEKGPFYSPFASEITIWRVTFHTLSPFGERRI